MKQLLTALALILLVPAFAQAVSDEQWGYAREISQRWVEEHDQKLNDLVKKTAQLVSKEGNDLIIASKRSAELPKTKLKTENAGDYGIPDQVVSSRGVTVGLTKLFRTRVQFVPGGELDFLTADYYGDADYYDELDPTDSISDIYIKIGMSYRPLFHGEGYHHCANIFWLDQTEKEAPVFFEVGQYGGGSQVDKTIYTLDKNKIASIPQLLFDSPEKIHPDDFIQKKLNFSVWLSGETSYQNMSGDDDLEIVNVTRVPYPDDLKTKLAQKYGFKNTDFINSFRKAVSVYQWDDKKQKFDDLGDFYY